MEKSLSVILAADLNFCIGKLGPEPLVWKQKADLKRFKSLTTNQVVIMGYNTFKSLGRPLPNRINVVVTSRHNDEVETNFESVIVANSLEEACALSFTVFPEKKRFLIGGAMLYNEAFKKDYVKEVFLTRLRTRIFGDAVVDIPNPFSDEWELTSEPEKFDSDEDNQFDYMFIDARRK